jgi:4-amino-4-deoxy-L-arabinose transferase-like glycosyltransferase
VPLSVLRLTSAFVLFAAVLLMYVLACERWAARVGLVAAYALGLYVPFLGLLSNLHSEVLAVLFVVVGMLGLARFLERGGLVWLVVGGAGLAGLALTRVAYGWVLTVVLALLVGWWLVRRSRSSGRAAAVLALALALCLPWLAYTYSKTDRLFVWGNSGSLSLYWMTSPHEGDLGDWHQAHLVFTDPDLRPHREFFESLRGLDLAEQNAEIEREALGNIADHPDAYAENVVANVSRMFFNSPYSRTRQQTNDVFYALPNAILLGAAVLCAFVLVPRRRLLPAETGVFVLFASTGFALHALVSAYPRMLAPIVPLLVWLTVLAVVEAGLLRPSAARGTPLPSRSS